MDQAAVIRRWWDEVWGEERLDLVPELVGEPYVRHGPTGTVTRDHAGLCKDLAQYLRVLSHPTVSFDDMAVAGDKVWSRVTMEGVNRETGDVRTVSWLQVHRLAGGKIVESWMLYANDVDWR